MSEAFAPGARRLAGMVCRSLGWRPADFWVATPAEIAAIFAAAEVNADASLSRADFATLMEQDANG